GEFARRLSESPREVNIRRIEDFCRRYGNLESLPNQKSRDPLEREDAAWLSQKRQAKKGQGRQAFFPEMDEIAASFGMAGLFEVRDPKANALQRATELCKLLAAGAKVP